MDLKTLSMILSERNVSSSALKLDKASFVGVYRYIMRYVIRYHRNACKLLISLDANEDISKAETLDYCEKFGDHIGNVLRRSDLLMQVRKNMYFVILTDIKQEAVEQVVGNIIRSWRESYGDVLNINYETEFLESEKLYTGGDERLWVVVVDDDVMNRKLAERILSKSDIEVATLSSGEELMTFVKDNRPDLILLDINMPGMDGFETLTKLREEETEIADIPVVFLLYQETIYT